MKRFVAFLRGVNVGGRKVLKEDLVDCFVDMGFSEVKTVLQSGNVVFTVDSGTQSHSELLEITEKIEKGLEMKFNYPAKVIVLSLEELIEIVKQYPLKTKQEGIHDYIAFFKPEIDLGTEEFKQDHGVEKWIASSKHQVIYWQVEKGKTLDSEFDKVINQKQYKQFNTVRNLNTLEKILKFQD